MSNETWYVTGCWFNVKDYCTLQHTILVEILLMKVGQVRDSISIVDLLS